MTDIAAGEPEPLAAPPLAAIEELARAIDGAAAPFYASRRRALAESLLAEFGDRIAVDLRPGGMHLIARFGDGVSDVNLAQLAQAGGVSRMPPWRESRSLRGPERRRLWPSSPRPPAQSCRRRMQSIGR